MELTDFFTSRKQTKQPLQDARKEAMFAELHSLLSSGLDFSRSFSLLIEGERNAAGRALLTELYRSVVRGESLGRAFERSERFAPLDCGVLRIGEETGRLDEALAFLADYYGKRIAQRRMVSGAVSYPLIILFTAVVVVIFMVLVIVPMFEQVYSRMGGELPAMTRWIISLSKAFPAYLAVTVFMALGGWFWWRTFGGRPGVQRMAPACPTQWSVSGGFTIAGSSCCYASASKPDVSLRCCAVKGMCSQESSNTASARSEVCSSQS